MELSCENSSQLLVVTPFLVIKTPLEQSVPTIEMPGKLDLQLSLHYQYQFEKIIKIAIAST